MPKCLAEKVSVTGCDQSYEQADVAGYRAVF